MVYAVPNLDYEAELKQIREVYISASPEMRLKIIRLRLDDHHFGANRLVTVVSAVEALARSLAMSSVSQTKAEMKAVYSSYKRRVATTLVAEYLLARGVANAKDFFGEDTWALFHHAVEYRNMLAHECTYLGQDKYPSLICACEEIIETLVKLGEVRERRT
jgi:hypothetical protein